MNTSSKKILNEVKDYVMIFIGLLSYCFGYTAFVLPEVKKAIKAKEVEPEVLAVLKKVAAMNDEEKKLKKQIKDESAQLHQKTKETIESLSDEQVLALLEHKWITPLTNSLSSLPKAVIETLAKKVSNLAQKYATTLNDLESEIERTEKEFSSMLDELTGSEFDMKGLAELKNLLRGWK